MDKYYLVILFSLSLNVNAGVNVTTPENATKSLCVPSMEKFEACKQAVEMVNEILPTLPAQSDELTIMESVSSNGPIVIFHARLTGNKEQIASYFKKQGLKLEDIESEMEKWTMEFLCKKDTVPFNFITLGGHIRFVTNYKNAAHQQTVNVKSCDNKMLEN